MEPHLRPLPPHLAARALADAVLSVPAVEGSLGAIRLAAHQVDAAQRILGLLRTAGGAVLADSTGMGKTFVAIAVARATGPALVVAPAALRGMWTDSLSRTGVDADFISFEALSQGRTAGRRPSLLILDEAHHARNPSSRRYGALADLAWGASVLALTATPVHNRRRDLRALIALFVGSAAFRLSEGDIEPFVIRREARSSGTPMPRIRTPRWHPVPQAPDVLSAIAALPEAVSAADGTVAHALLRLGLIRAWCSSEAALHAALRRRLQGGAVLQAALDTGTLPTRRALAAWPVVDASVQLGFQGLFAGAGAAFDDGAVRDAIERHLAGVRRLLQVLDEHRGAADEKRVELIADIRDRRPGVPVVAFTQFADTARAMYDALAGGGGVALVSGRGGRIASGRTGAADVVRRFDIASTAVVEPAMPMEVLIATDVLSEGLSLRRAGTLVHLDLPWTIARLEQRVGRVRRPGSPHRVVHVHAIGPPVATSALVGSIRALQRKARLAVAFAGGDELEAVIPLLGTRLARATTSVVQRSEVNCRERIRDRLIRWREQRWPAAVIVPEGRVGLACLTTSSAPRLVAIRGGRVVTSVQEVLVAVEQVAAALSTRTGQGAPVPDAPELAVLQQWIACEHGLELVRGGPGTAGAAHSALLRRLSALVAAAGRVERASVAEAVERCRNLVRQARGIGAERALDGFARSRQALDLAVLEARLADRLRPLGDSPVIPEASRVMVLIVDGASVGACELDPGALPAHPGACIPGLATG